MAEKNELAGLPDDKAPPPESAAPAEEPAATMQPAPPKGTLEDFKVPQKEIDASPMERLEVPLIHGRIQTELESDRGYYMIAERIIAASQEHLSEQQRDKMTLRKRFAILFSALLMLEYIFLVIFILLDAIAAVPVDIPEPILQLYTTSVFVQTLTAMGVMIAFAFVSKEETRIVGLLNQIIRNYQKVSLDPDEGGQNTIPPGGDS